MSASPETAALVALLRLGRRPPSHYAELIEDRHAATEILETEVREDEHGQTTLSQPGAGRDLIDAATKDIEAWTRSGIKIKTILDPDYPVNLRMVHDRPPLIFVAGRLEAQDRRAVAVIGTRRPTQAGIERAQHLAVELAQRRFTVISGLAKGIDTAVHAAVLNIRQRTIAVIGTGVDRSYPPENELLQRQLAVQGAVVSQFWPDAGPTKASFPMRNALMSGLALATVIVEAFQTSGTRTQARLALAHGRPVFLHRGLLSQDWATDLAARPGTYVFDEPAEVAAQTERLTETGSLVG